MALHCLSAAPGSEAFGQCLRVAAAGDALLLVGEACYALLPGSEAQQELARCQGEVHVLRQDLKARGLSAGSASVIDDEGFVALSEVHQQQVAWY